MIGILVVADGPLDERQAGAVSPVLGSGPSQYYSLRDAATDEPLYLPPKARALVDAHNTGDGVLIFTDIYGATPCNLAAKLLVAGRVEAVAGVNLPMLVRAFTYRDKGMETMIKKAISGGCDGVLHIDVDPIYAATRS